MAKKLKLGIIGMSDGNGHPFSWSAIFNGYNKEAMSLCPFPIIPSYLNKHKFPEDYLSKYAEVTYIWTQNRELSESIARASRIKHVCESFEEMIGKIDGLLLARDDAENHYFFSKLFLKAGIPVYIDKPFALSINEAHRLWESCIIPNQIFSCSALQFAKEFKPENINELGDIRYISAMTPKSWEKYSPHIIEPSLNLIPYRGEIVKISHLTSQDRNLNNVTVIWSTGIVAQFQSTGKLPSPLSIRVLGTNGHKELIFKDTFNAFKKTLKKFIDIIRKEDSNISKDFTLEMVKILENGIT